MRIPSIPKPNLSMKNVSQAFNKAGKSMRGVASNFGHFVQDEFKYSKKVISGGFLGADSKNMLVNSMAAGAIMLSNILQYSIDAFGESTEKGKSDVKKFEKYKGVLMGVVGGLSAGVLTRSKAPDGKMGKWIAHAAVLGAVVDIACSLTVPHIAEKFGKRVHNKKQENEALKEEKALNQNLFAKKEPKIVEAEFEQDIQYVEIPVGSTELKR